MKDKVSVSCVLWKQSGGKHTAEGIVTPGVGLLPVFPCFEPSAYISTGWDRVVPSSDDERSPSQSMILRFSDRTLGSVVSSPGYGFRVNALLRSQRKWSALRFAKGLGESEVR